MKVFVSSTVYDLLDIRGEIEQLLRELGVTPVMSDEKLSGFNHSYDENSIETCLLNVESSDAVIVILDQRYGPSLGSHGFDDVSATHLEYLHAKKHKKPIYFYVRDRLEADFNIDKKNTSKDNLKLSWIKPNDKGLFKFLKDHRNLEANEEESNWVTVFSNSVDLKESIRKHFEPVIKPQVLMNAMQDNRFPLFTCKCNVEPIFKRPGTSLLCCVKLENISLTPALCFSVQWNTTPHEKETVKLVGPGQCVDTSKTVSVASYKTKYHFHLMVEYQSFIGISVKEQYNVEFYMSEDIKALVSSTSLIERIFYNDPLPPLVIEDM